MTFFILLITFYLSYTKTLISAAGNLPFSTLPSNNCTAPSICDQVQGTLNCRCDPTITVCYNDKHQYCWGSSTLHETSACPAIPSSCQAGFNSTASCLCNSTNILCIDQYSHVCYGAIQKGSSTVTLLPLGGISPLSSTTSSTVSSTLASSSMVATSTPLPQKSDALSSSSLVSPSSIVFLASLAFSLPYF
ncbi:uncharacterized protein BX664DRAFT_339510 [Halteromyces radiatus]|uniref:uncharacterized protein n=1 Tax=Halteromyces radiatus TaxID=101107 RepID=UPI002220F026|nr:uncharacterized protein BX664DRAFT_339510 [Halteromyces radiatus]KAI8082966.1 hypothetical protein BX664DRAFT_339510 [Halteromyces radiatus]